MSKTFEHSFQKDVYIIINGYRENFFRIQPSKTTWSAGNFVSDSASIYTNIPSEYTTYIPSIDCAIDRGLDLSSSDGTNILGQFYDFLKSRGWNGTNYPSGIPPYAIPFMRELNLFSNYIKKKELTVSGYTQNTNPNSTVFDIIIPFYISERSLFYHQGLVKETSRSRDYSSLGFFRESKSELSDSSNIKVLADDYVNNKPKDGTIDYWIQIGNIYMLNYDQLTVQRAGVFGKEPDTGISLFLIPYQYVPPYKGNWTDQNVAELIGIIKTEAFLYIIYGYRNYIKFVQAYQKRPPNFNEFIFYKGEKRYKISSVSELADSAYTFIGTFVCPYQEGAIGISIKYIYPSYVYCEFHNKIMGNNYSENVHQRFLKDLPASWAGATQYGSYRSVNVQPGTKRYSFNIEGAPNAFRLPYPYAWSSGLLLVDPSTEVRLYLNAFNTYAFTIMKPAYSVPQRIISGDKFTAILYDRNAVLVGDFGGINEISMHSSSLSIQTSVLKRNVNKWQPADINTPNILVNELTDYQVNNDVIGLPDTTKLPVYRFSIVINSTLDYSQIAQYLRMFTVPVPFYKAEISQSGIFFPGYIRTPQKVVIPPEKILSISITRGSVFDEHAVVSIWNENGEYNFLKNLTEYNVLITADYTKDYAISNDSNLVFINNIPAEELGISPNSVVLFRGISDYENPVSYKIQRLGTGNITSQEIITLNIQGVFHKVKQMVPIVAESFNAFTHVDAIKEILFRAGFNVDVDFIYDTQSPDGDVILMPPVPTYNTGYLIEPPNNYGEFVRKIVNEFSGWWFYYRHINGKFYYTDRYFRIPTENPNEISYFYSKYNDFINNYYIKPSRVLFVYDADVRVIKPVATQILLYGGSVYPQTKTDYVAVNRRAVEDPNYEFYIGRNIPVFVFSPLTQDRALRMILKNLSYRMLIGHKIANIKFFGAFGTGTFGYCWIDGLGYGIIKNASTDYGSDKILRGEAEVELVNYTDRLGRQYAIFWDEL